MTTQKRKIFIMILMNLFLLGFVGKRVWAEAETKICVECHEEEVASFNSENHRKAWLSKSETADNACTTCHGDSTQHVKSDGGKSMTLGFVKDVNEKSKELNELCLKCHELSIHLTFWDSGKHARNSVACSSCHKMHKRGSKVKPAPYETCIVTCHTEIKLLVNKRSHHPIIEGKVTCNDCHSPHGAMSKFSLTDDSVNQTCYKCHTDKRGPYMWEHMPVEENCTTCHNPHGSRNYKLLVEKVPNLCQNCHDYSGHPGSVYDATVSFSAPGAISNRFIGRGCINCHVKIHGSTAPVNPASKGNSGQYFLR